MIGTHGTFKSNKKNILTFGFKKPLKPGMYGSAVYFWRDEVYGYELAIAWLRQKVDRYKRNGRKHENSGVVFVAEFSFSDDSDAFIILDYDLISEVEKFSTEKKISIESAYDLYLSRIEKKTGVPIVALQGSCPPPKKQYFDGLSVKKSNIAFTIAIIDVRCIRIIKPNIKEFII